MPPTVHKSWPGILPSLPAIETSAAHLFLANPATAFLTTEPGLTLSDFQRHHDAGLLWVVAQTDPNDSPLAQGFLAASLIDDYLHVDEVDVAAEWQGKGLARALMGAAMEEAVRRGCRGLSLTTSRLAPWSFEWYERLGFRVVGEEVAAPGLVRVLRGERENWKEVREYATSRVIMVMGLGDGKGGGVNEAG